MKIVHGGHGGGCHSQHQGDTMVDAMVVIIVDAMVDIMVDAMVNIMMNAMVDIVVDPMVDAMGKNAHLKNRTDDIYSWSDIWSGLDWTAKNQLKEKSNLSPNRLLVVIGLELGFFLANFFSCLARFCSISPS